MTRLTEMATVFSVLSRIETIARPHERWALPEEILDEVDIRPKFEARIESLLKTIDKRKAGDILAFFDTDRVAAWNIVDFVYMLLSLYQTTDSTLDGSPLTFFNQREWRLVFHTRHGLEWIGLGNHPLYRDPDAPRLAKNRRELTRFLLDDVTRRTPKDDYLRGCWALHTVDGAHFRNFVNELVVPPQYVDRAKALVSTYPFPAGAPVVYSAADV